MDKYIVVINGTGGSGKDTFVNYVSKYNKVFNFSSIDRVKEIAKMVGWNPNIKTEKDRKFLSDLKKLTTDYNDMSFESIKSAINDFKNDDNEIMFIHIREPEQIKRVVDEFGAKTLLIKREGLDTIKSNYSDANVENYDYDYIIFNSTLDKLEESAKEFYEQIKN